VLLRDLFHVHGLGWLFHSIYQLDTYADYIFVILQYFSIKGHCKLLQRCSTDIWYSSLLSGETSFAIYIDNCMQFHRLLILLVHVPWGATINSWYTRGFRMGKIITFRACALNPRSCMLYKRHLHQLHSKER